MFALQNFGQGGLLPGRGRRKGSTVEPASPHKEEKITTAVHHISGRQVSPRYQFNSGNNRGGLNAKEISFENVDGGHGGLRFTRFRRFRHGSVKRRTLLEPDAFWRLRIHFRRRASPRTRRCPPVQISWHDSFRRQRQFDVGGAHSRQWHTSAGWLDGGERDLY